MFGQELDPVSCTVCKSSRKYSAFDENGGPLPGLVEHPPPPPPCCQLSVHSWQRSIFSWQSLVPNWLPAKNKTAADSFQIVAPCQRSLLSLSQLQSSTSCQYQPEPRTATVTQPAVSSQPVVSLGQLSVLDSNQSSASCQFLTSCQYSASCLYQPAVCISQLTIVIICQL